jgi:hypothetical protein
MFQPESDILPRIACAIRLCDFCQLEKVGGWEIIYEGEWQYKYQGYKRPAEKQKCDLGCSKVNAIGVSG